MVAIKQSSWNPLDHWQGFSERNPIASTAMSMLPGVGVATGAADTANALRQGNYGSAAASAIGTGLSVLPFGGVAKNVGGLLGRGAFWLARPFMNAGNALRTGAGVQNLARGGFKAVGNWAGKLPGAGIAQSAAKIHDRMLAPMQSLGWKTRLGLGVGSTMAGNAFDAYNNPQKPEPGPEPEQQGPAQHPGQENAPMERMASHRRRIPSLLKRAAGELEVPSQAGPPAELDVAGGSGEAPIPGHLASSVLTHAYMAPKGSKIRAAVRAAAPLAGMLGGARLGGHLGDMASGGNAWARLGGRVGGGLLGHQLAGHGINAVLPMTDDEKPFHANQKRRSWLGSLGIGLAGGAGNMAGLGAGTAGGLMLGNRLGLGRMGRLTTGTIGGGLGMLAGGMGGELLARRLQDGPGYGYEPRKEHKQEEKQSSFSPDASIMTPASHRALLQKVSSYRQEAARMAGR